MSTQALESTEKSSISTNDAVATAASHKMLAGLDMSAMPKNAPADSSHLPNLEIAALATPAACGALGPDAGACIKALRRKGYA